MSVLSMTVSLTRLQNDEIAWKLLRTKNAPAIIAILDAHLGGTTRRLPVPELVSLVEVDIEELRYRMNIDLERSAVAYCDQWRTDGYLVRRPVAQARQETYELSAGALTAIGFAKRLVQPHRSATQSRLGIIVDQINSLALATDHNAEHRKHALLEERERIDEQLKRLDEGKIDVIDQVQALEKAQDILHLAQEIPSDFVHVRDDFEYINRSLYSTIINYEEGHREVLEDVFSGVDQITQSAAGRSFKGFYSLLRDTDLTETLQDDIDAILDADYAEDLSIEDRRFLRNLLGAFLEQSQEVNSVMTAFARGLRRFVQTQEYQSDRVMKQQLDKALGKSHTIVAAVPLNRRIQDPLDLTAVPIRPISRWKLKNPTESRAAGIEELGLESLPEMTLAELRELARETEIDFGELVDSVNTALATALEDGQTSISVAHVLSVKPATQGVASIVGLMVLAEEQGRCVEGTEIVQWKTRTGESRRAQIAAMEFFREVEL